MGSDRLRRAIGRLKRQMGRRPEPKASPPSYPSVELVWWKPVDGLNFGDVLSAVVVTKILADNGHSLFDQTSRPVRLLGIGSILHFARDGDVVWGSGRNGKMPEERHAFTSLDVRAVRGPLTRDFLRKKAIETADIYGDPALLLPMLFPTLRPTGRTAVAIVPNLHDATILDARRIDYVSPKLGWNVCVRRILDARLVVASSLHGLVVAEAFGIPARYVRLSERESIFKYEDYVLGTGRENLDPASSLEEAQELGGMPPIRFDARRLYDAFPLDLWRS